MLAGEPPFTGPTPQAILARVMTEEPRPLTLRRKTVPPHVEAAVARALEKLPADRFQTAADFAAALTRCRARARRSSGHAPCREQASVGGAVGAVGGSAGRARLGAVSGSGRSRPSSTGRLRFSVELDPGVQPTFTPIVRLSADGRQLFIAAMIDRRDEILHLSVRPDANAGDRRRGPGRSGDREQQAVPVARWTVDRVHRPGEAPEGPGRGRARGRPR